jgi:hypothetical protein
MMTVRGEPDDVAQVPRRLAYEKTHPKTEIIYVGPYWQAILREDRLPDDHHPAQPQAADGQAGSRR